MLARPTARTRRRRHVVAVAVVGLASLAAASGAYGFPTTQRASVTSAGDQSDNGSYYEGISGNGRFVFFETGAALVSGDTNGLSDVYVRDRRGHTTRRASVSSTGRQANGASGYAAMSPNGRFVVFWSEASNLVPGDTNGKSDIFLRDREKHITRRVSVSSAEKQGSGGNGCSGSAVTNSGRFVLFSCDFTNLVPNDTSSAGGLYVRDRTAGKTRRVDVSSSEKHANAGVDGYPSPTAISADGRFVVFNSTATNLVKGDLNGVNDVFLRDRARGTTTRLSKSSAGVAGDASSGAPAMTPDARLVVFHSNATNLVPGDGNATGDIFLRNRATGKTSRLSLRSTGGESNGGSSYPGISSNGRFVSFDSGATDLVGGDTNGTTDVFVRDRKTSQTRRVSVTFDDAQANGSSSFAFISADGRFVAFQSDATNLIQNDTNAVTDIYVRGPIH